MSSEHSNPERSGGVSARRRDWSRWLLRLAVSSALLTVVVLRTDASRFSELAAQVHWGGWIVGLTLVLVAPVASAQRGRLLIRGLGHRVSLVSVVAVNLEAIFFGLVLPGELVAGVVRWQRFSSHTGDRTGALTVLAAERLIDGVVLALLTAVGAHLLFAGESAQRLRMITAAVAGGAAALGIAMVLAGRSRLSVRVALAWRDRCGPRIGAWVEHLVRLLRGGQALAGDIRRSVEILLWTAIFWCVFLAGSVMMAQAVFPSMPVLPYAVATAALVLLTQIPLTIAGVGLRELSLPMLLAAYGVSAGVGLLVGLSAFLPYVVLGLAGFVCRLVGRARLVSEGPSR